MLSSFHGCPAPFASFHVGAGFLFSLFVTQNHVGFFYHTSLLAVFHTQNSISCRHPPATACSGANVFDGCEGRQLNQAPFCHIARYCHWQRHWRRGQKDYIQQPTHPRKDFSLVGARSDRGLHCWLQRHAMAGNKHTRASLAHSGIYANIFSHPQHNSFFGSCDIKLFYLGLSLGFFGIFSARTIGTLIKRHINSVSGRRRPGLRLSCFCPQFQFIYPF